MKSNKTKLRKRRVDVRSSALVSLQLTRDDMLHVWRAAIVNHQTTLNSRAKLGYARIITACDRILYPKAG